MTTTNQTEVLKALCNIEEITETEFVLTNKDLAMELSQFIIDNGGNGSVTGPFVSEKYNNKPVTYMTKQYYYVQK